MLGLLIVFDDLLYDRGIGGKEVDHWIYHNLQPLILSIEKDAGRRKKGGRGESRETFHTDNESGVQLDYHVWQHRTLRGRNESCV
jgi:macrodomain Ter protein organizer (MatP/YcbG family)